MARYLKSCIRFIFFIPFFIIFAAIIVGGIGVHAAGLSDEEDEETGETASGFELIQDGIFKGNYETIGKALIAAGNTPSTIVLNEDVSDGLEVPAYENYSSYSDCDITIDLNGHILSCTDGHAIKVYNGKLRIINEKLGGMITNGNSSTAPIFCAGGELYLGSSDNPEYNNFSVRALFTNIFDSQCQQSKCTIYGGTYEPLQKTVDYLSSGFTLSIYGGSFKDDTIKEYLDSGKKLEYKNNWYNVVDKEKIASPDGPTWGVNHNYYSDYINGFHAMWNYSIDEETESELKEFEVYAVYEKGDQRVASEHYTTTDYSYDFSAFFDGKGEGTYSFYVKAISGNELYLDSEIVEFSLDFYKINYETTLTGAESEFSPISSLTTTVYFYDQEIIRYTGGHISDEFIVPKGSSVEVKYNTRPGYVFENISYEADKTPEDIVEDEENRTISFTLNKTFEFILAFTKDETSAVINIDMGEGHEVLAENVAEKLKSRQAVREGSVVTIVYPKASTLQDITSLLENMINVILHYSSDHTYDYSEDSFIDNGEMHWYYDYKSGSTTLHLPVLALKPLSEFSGGEEIDTYLSGRDTIATTDNLNLYMLWIKPIGRSEFEVTVPSCGYEVELNLQPYGTSGDSEYIQSNVPEVKKLSGEHIKLQSMRTDEEGLYSAWLAKKQAGILTSRYSKSKVGDIIDEILYQGTMSGTDSYYPAFSLKCDFGYYVNTLDEEACIYINGQKADVASSPTSRFVRACGSIEVNHEEEIIPGIEASCTEDGMSEGKKCKRCQAVYVEPQVIESFGHNYVEVEGTAVKVTCTSNGREADKKCTRCQDLIEGAVIESKGHIEVVIPAKAPSCDEKGNTEGTKCSVCGEIFVAPEEIEATGHVWDEGKVIKEPTETEKGSKVYTCKVCGGIREEEIPATGKKDNPDEKSSEQPVSDQKPVQEDGVGTISADGKTLTDTDGVKYLVAEKMTADQLTKNAMIADKASAGKYKITAVTMKNGKVVGGTVAYNKPYNKNCKTATIGATVDIAGVTFKITTVANNAFRGCKKLTKVTIGKNITKIGSNAFNGCSKLKNVIFKTSKLKKIGKNAFKGVKAKAKFKVPKKKLKKYKKIIKKAGAPKKAKVTK